MAMSNEGLYEEIQAQAKHIRFWHDKEAKDNRGVFACLRPCLGAFVAFNVPFSHIQMLTALMCRMPGEPSQYDQNGQVRMAGYCFGAHRMTDERKAMKLFNRNLLMEASPKAAIVELSPSFPSDDPEMWGKFPPPPDGTSLSQVLDIVDALGRPSLCKLYLDGNLRNKNPMNTKMVDLVCALRHLDGSWVTDWHQALTSAQQAFVVKHADYMRRILKHYCGSFPRACWVCGETQGISRCAVCQEIWYCGKAHQVQDWKHHKKCCAVYQSLRNNKPFPGGLRCQIRAFVDE